MRSKRFWTPWNFPKSNLLFSRRYNDSYRSTFRVIADVCNKLRRYTHTFTAHNLCPSDEYGVQLLVRLIVLGEVPPVLDAENSISLPPRHRKIIYTDFESGISDQQRERTQKRRTKRIRDRVSRQRCENRTLRYRWKSDMTADFRYFCLLWFDEVEFHLRALGDFGGTDRREIWGQHVDPGFVLLLQREHQEPRREL